MNTHHNINYVEFPAADLTAVKKFYSAAFGWAFTDYGPTYTAFSVKSVGIDGGFSTESKRGQSGPLVILYSENLEESLKAVEENGGTLTKAIYSFPGGRRFHFADPAGNELAVWSDKE